MLRDLCSRALAADAALAADGAADGWLDLELDLDLELGGANHSGGEWKGRAFWARVPVLGAKWARLLLAASLRGDNPATVKRGLERLLKEETCPLPDDPATLFPPEWLVHVLARQILDDPKLVSVSRCLPVTFFFCFV